MVAKYLRNTRINPEIRVLVNLVPIFSPRTRRNRNLYKAGPDPGINGMIPFMGGRYHIITNWVYKWYISYIYCQLGDYMVPTTY